MGKTEELRVDHDTAYTFIVGDPQGRTDLLYKMLETIEKNPSGLPFAANDKVVIMGNFLKKAEDMQEMITLLRQYKKKRPDQLVILRGWTEDRLIKTHSFIFKEAEGRKLINSYRTGTTTYGYYKKPKLELRKFVADAKWVHDNTVKFYSEEKFFCAPSGVSPRIPIEQNHVNSLMYWDKDFRAATHSFGRMVFHGTHAEGAKVHIKTNRINVNTQAADTNILSCAVVKNKTGEMVDVISITETKKESKK